LKTTGTTGDLLPEGKRGTQTTFLDKKKRAGVAGQGGSRGTPRNYVYKENTGDARRDEEKKGGKPQEDGCCAGHDYQN